MLIGRSRAGDVHDVEDRDSCGARPLQQPFHFAQRVFNSSELHHAAPIGVLAIDDDQGGVAGAPSAVCPRPATSRRVVGCDITVPPIAIGPDRRPAIPCYAAAPSLTIGPTAEGSGALGRRRNCRPLGHSKRESAVRCLGIEVGGALASSNRQMGCAPSGRYSRVRPEAEGYSLKPISHFSKSSCTSAFANSIGCRSLYVRLGFLRLRPGGDVDTGRCTLSSRQSLRLYTARLFSGVNACRIIR